MPVDSRLPAPPGFRDREESAFQLEASPEGLRLVVSHALMGTAIEIRNLRLEVIRPPGTLDLSRGPRSLQSVWTRLEGVEVLMSVPGSLRSEDSDIEELSFRVLEEGRRAWVGGRLRGVPFSLRLRPVPLGEEAASPDLVIQFEEPRLYGVSEIPWNDVASRVVAALVPGILVVHRDRNRAVLRILPALLRGLLVERGFKVPDLRRVRFVASRSEANRLVLVFQEGPSERTEGTAPVEGPDGPPSEEEIRQRLREADLHDVGVLIDGLRVTRLWPEVLHRCHLLSEERPDQVIPSLVALVISGRRPEWVSPEDLFHGVRRLVRVLAEEEGRRDLSLASRFLTAVTERLAPAHAWALVEEVLALGVRDPEWMRVGSACLEVLGRPGEAEAMRSRMLALAGEEDLEDLVQRTLSDLDRAGLSRVGDEWLAGVLRRSEETGLKETRAGRVLRKVQALRRMADHPEEASALWKSLIEEDPLDPEIQALVRLSLTDDSQAHELAQRLVEQARRGPSGRDLLRFAASLLETRPGLRWRAVQWYEESLEGEAHPEPILDILDRLYRALGRTEDLQVLLRRRIEADPESPKAQEWRMDLVREWLDQGQDSEAAEFLREVLRRQPTHREALRQARALLVRWGDFPALREVQEILRDLGDEPIPAPSTRVSEDDPLAVVQGLEDPEEVDQRLGDLTRWAAEAMTDPERAGRLLGALVQAMVRIERRKGRPASDLRELVTWMSETLSAQSLNKHP